MTRQRTVFFGSGPVAAVCLEKLLAHTDIEAVVTKPKAAHPKAQAPVIDVANTHKIPVHTVRNKQELEDLLIHTHFQSTYAILIDFGIIVSQQAINHFPLGIINSHFSLLPKLRGADPITFSILLGHEKTGVSLMCIDEGMDTGKLLTQRTLHLDQTETEPVLTEKLIELSDELLKEYIPKYTSGDIHPKNQPHPDRATYSRKLTKQDGLLDWNKPAIELERQIRALITWPQSYGKIGSIDVIITSANVVCNEGNPGEYTTTKDSLVVHTADKSLGIKSIKPLGKKEMPIEAFLAGYKSRL